MKIVHIIYDLRSGGAERFVVNLANEQQCRQHKVCVITLRDDSIDGRLFNKMFLDSNVQYINCGFDGGISVKMINEVYSLLVRIKPDVVHCHMLVATFLVRYIVHNHRVVNTLHSVPNKVFQSRLKRIYYSFLFKRNLVVPVTISKLCDESYRNMFQLTNSFMIQNGCPMVRPTRELNAVADFFSKIVHKGEISFVHVARNHSSKNQQLLIDSFNALYEDGYCFKLFVIGAQFDNAEGLLLKKKSCENIFFLGEKTNVGDYLLCADAFCLTSEYEGLPISLLEALSAGVTPICTPVGGIPDVITDGVTGYLSAGMSVDDYCAAVKRFIASPIDKELLKKYFLDNYSMTKCALQYEQLYDEIVHNKD